MVKIEFKLESDNHWRAYTRLDNFYGSDRVWVPVAVNRRKELCIREAKRCVAEIPKHYIPIT